MNLQMSDQNIEIRVLLRFFWKKGLITTAATQEICEVEGKYGIERFNHLL